QEIIDRPGWAKGNAVAFMIDGTGRRTAEAKDGLTAPVLLLQFKLQKSGPANVAPTVDAGADKQVTMPGPAQLAGSVTDDGLPVPPGETTALWEKVSGPGTVKFANPNAASTTATFSAAGPYVLKLTGNDGALQTVDEVNVQVNPAVQQPAAVNLTLSASPTNVTVPGQTTLSGKLKRTTGQAVGNES